MSAEYALMEECLKVVGMIRATDGAQIDPATLRIKLGEVVERATSAAEKEFGKGTEDVTSLRYAIVAFLDEVVRERGGEVYEYWRENSLQWAYFHENRAGKGFFEELDEALVDPERGQLLRCYYLCMLLGFKGKFRYQEYGGDAARAELMQKVRGVVHRQQVTAEPGLLLRVPRQGNRGRLAKKVPLLWISVLCLVITVSVYFMLSAGLSGLTNEVLAVIDRA